MPVAEISVQIKNKPGQLCAIAAALAEANVVVRGITASSSGRVGWVRIVADNGQIAATALEDAGFIVESGEALLILLENDPAGLDKALQVLSDAGTNVDYIYTCSSKTAGNQLAVIGVQSPDKAEKLLLKHDVRVCDLRN